jgi:LysR family transcriptional regulator, glycine cleavage system transcriptional activator
MVPYGFQKLFLLIDPRPHYRVPDNSGAKHKFSSIGLNILMQNLLTQLPNLNTLIAFEAAGRLNSFTVAAEELCLTQGAVSHQIKQLEHGLGVKLFRRDHKKVTLTQEGERFLRTASQAIYQIAAATRDLRTRSASNRLMMATSDAVCLHWLMPRMTELRAFEPGIDLQVVSFQDNPIGQNRDFDVGIQCGRADWSGYRSERLAPGQLIPVCSPSYFNNRDRFTDPNQLKEEILLEFEHNTQRQHDWRYWFQSLDVKGPYPEPFFRLSNYLIMNKAVFEGQGIALGWRYLIDDHIANNWFEIAYPAALKTREDFYLVTPVNKTLNKQQRSIRDWIIEEFRSAKAPF